MSIPQQLTWSGADGPAAAKGGTLVFGPLFERPSQNVGAAPTVSLYGRSGEAYVTDQAATIEGPSTIPTLTQAIRRGEGATTDAPIRVTSTTGITSRMYLLLGTPNSGRPAELVRVRTVLSDTTGLVLFGPVLHDHERGASIGGCRLKATIASASCTTKFRKGRAVWSWGTEGSASLNRTAQIAAEVVRYPLIRLASGEDLRKIDASWYAKIAFSRDTEELLDEAWDEVRRQVWRRQIWGLVTSEGLRWPTALAAAWLELSSHGPQFAERAEYLKNEFLRVLENSIESNPVDIDEDGQITEREQPLFSTVRIGRAS